MEKLIRLPKVAELLGVSKSTVWMYAREGKIPKGKKMSPRVTVWAEKDIVAFIEKMSA